VLYKKQKTHDYVVPKEMKQLMLNDPNGTMFETAEQLHIVSAVRRACIQPRYATVLPPGPEHYRFEIQWGNKPKWEICNYNWTLFQSEAMQTYLKSNVHTLDYSSFESHYQSNLELEPKQYRFCPKRGKTEASVKVTLGNNVQVSYNVKEAKKYFGVAGFENIKRQYENLHDCNKIAWFQVATCLQVGLTTGLGSASLAMMEEPSSKAQPDNYAWVVLFDNLWIKRQVLKTHGAFCLIAASLNASLLPQDLCLKIFNELEPNHYRSGEVKAGWLLKQLDEMNFDNFTFKFHKCTPLQSFEEFATSLDQDNKEEVYIVCYKTLNGSSHAICWDSVGKRIFDPDFNNPEVFTYTEFRASTSTALTITSALHTTINEPCIFYVAYWKLKKKRKR